MRRHPLERHLRAAFTMAELMIAMVISSLLCAALITGGLSLQRSFLASAHHLRAQAQQMRLMDYMGMDLRRALSVRTQNGGLILEIPDYYDSSNEPRDPQIHGGTATYGTTPKQISYLKTGNTVHRVEGTAQLPLATDVSDFQLAFQDMGQSITISITFLPKFQFAGNNLNSVRAGTANFTTTLLRNKRQN